LCDFVSATFFCARETASQFLLSGTKKRHIQPERYVKYGLKWSEYTGNIVDKLNKI
jgi:hypothetical protein